MTKRNFRTACAKTIVTTIGSLAVLLSGCASPNGAGAPAQAGGGRPVGRVLPNLAVADLVVKPIPDGGVEISGRVRNVGFAPVGVASRLEIRMEPKDMEPRVLASAEVAGLAVGADYPFAVHVPEARLMVLPAFRIVARADAGDVVDETREDDNTAESMEMAYGPDLAISGARLDAGTLRIEVANRGNVSGRDVLVRVSAPASGSSTLPAVVLGERTIPRVEPGSPASVVELEVVNATAVAIEADPERAIAETDESNNGFALDVLAGAPAAPSSPMEGTPDLAIGNVTSRIVANRTIHADGRIVNRGSAPTMPFQYMWMVDGQMPPGMEPVRHEQPILPGESVPIARPLMMEILPMLRQKGSVMIRLVLMPMGPDADRENDAVDSVQVIPAGDTVGPDLSVRQVSIALVRSEGDTTRPDGLEVTALVANDGDRRSGAYQPEASLEESGPRRSGPVALGLAPGRTRLHRLTIPLTGVARPSRLVAVFRIAPRSADASRENDVRMSLPIGLPAIPDAPAPELVVESIRRATTDRGRVRLEAIVRNGGAAPASGVVVVWFVRRADRPAQTEVRTTSLAIGPGKRSAAAVELSGEVAVDLTASVAVDAPADAAGLAPGRIAEADESNNVLVRELPGAGQSTP